MPLSPLDPMKRSGASVVVCEAAVSIAAVSHLVMLCDTRYDTNLLLYGTIHAESFEDMVR